MLKEPKVYFSDSGYVEGDEGIRLENTVAACLLKHVHFLQDAKGRDISLHYIRTKDGKEVDFALAEKGVLTHFLEVKLSSDSVTRNLKYFKGAHISVKAIQLVQNVRNEQEIEGVSLVRAGDWLAQLAA